MDKVAIVILNWNGSRMLRSFLPSVIKYSKKDKVEIYVVDNGSTDDSVIMIQRDFHMVHLIMLGKNYGFAEGYNKALNQIKSEYVVLLNSDVEVTGNWLEPLIEYMDHHLETAACQPKILSYKERGKFEYAGAAGGFIDRYGYPFCRGRLFKSVEFDKGQYDMPVSVFWATGAAMFIRLDDYRKVGGLDGCFFAHMEEIDLCWRLRSLGRDIVCIPDSTVFHVGGATLKKEDPFKTMLNFRNNLIMLYKNLSGKELIHVMRIRKMLDFVAATAFMLKGQIPNAIAIFKARRQFSKMKSIYDKVRIEKSTENLHGNIVIPGQLKKSILVQYFIFRRHTFNKVKW